MNRTERIMLISLLSTELVESASKLNTALKKNPYASVGDGIETFDCKEAVKRKITTLRAELLELQKSL